MTGRVRWFIGGVLALASLGALAPSPSAGAGSPATVPATAITNVVAFGTTAGALPVYVATADGLYRSAAPDLSRWTKQSAVHGITVLSPNPQHPDDLLYVDADGLERSTDGGHSATAQSGCHPTDLARAPTKPSVVYASGLLPNDCIVSAATPPVGSISTSTDDGVTWTTVFTETATYENDVGFGPLTVDPFDPAHLLAGHVLPHNAVDLYESADGGRRWSEGLPSPVSYGSPIMALAFNPRSRYDVWVAWGRCDARVDHYMDGLSAVRVPVTPGVEATDLAVDPLTGRLYLALSCPDVFNGSPTTAVATMAGPSGVQALHAGISFGRRLVVTRNGYLLSGDATTPLVVRPLIASGNWGVAPALAHSAAAHGVLGGTLTPATTCAGVPCQSFDKGALMARGHGVYAAAPLVSRLMDARAMLPVGGSDSTVTYALLARLHKRRVPPPLGFRSGVAAVAGGTFIPATSDLRRGPGYIVPAPLWRYISDRRTAPDGWQRDVGVPLTGAVSAVVHKGRQGMRHILVQAFANAVLTDDPANPAPFSVERANIGVDYATIFPAAVR